jgi:uncharacterized protein (TIGR02186 family)
MSPKSRRAIAALVFAASILSPARAQDLVSGLSQDVIQITSNYSGSDIVVFGAIEHMDTDLPHGIVVVLRGPDAPVTIRRKERVAGIWINRDKASFTGMPAFYYVASTGPLTQIASNDVLARYGLGIQRLRPKSIDSHHDPEPFRQAFIRHEEQAALYSESQSGVEYLSETLFRVRVALPATVPPGQYNAEAYLFRTGNVVSAQTTPLFIDQTGLERRVYAFAHDWPLVYGLSAVIAAVLIGWLSSVVFRQH